MKVDANGLPLQREMAFVAINEIAKKPDFYLTTVVTNAAQFPAIENLTVKVSAQDQAVPADVGMEELGDKCQMKTFCGLELVSDDSIPKTEIQFRDLNGSILARIVNLELPASAVTA